MIKKFHLIFITGFFTATVTAQTLTPEQYVALYKDIAIREMKRMGVPAAISLAQGILETESGNSDLVKKSNNHFGIKCKSSWTAGGVRHDDDAPGECFRTYKCAEDSYRDHSNFLRGSDRYSFLFHLDPSDYKAWARGLKKAGYATNPDYPNILIRHIEQYHLQQYSIAGRPGMAKFETDKYQDDPIVFDSSLAMQKDPPALGPVAITPADKAGKSESNNFPPEMVTPAPGKITFINGSKCINAVKGTSLLAIATQYNVNLQKLLDINELEEDGLLIQDQLIFLQKKATTGDRDFIVVDKKETMYDVAQNNGILLESLLAYNNMAEDGSVLPGRKLFLKAMNGSDNQSKTTTDKTVTDKTVTDKIVTDKTVTDKTVIYQVQPKESLYAVAKKYNVTVKQLKEWNNLPSDDLRIGQQLIVAK